MEIVRLQSVPNARGHWTYVNASNVYKLYPYTQVHAFFVDGSLRFLKFSFLKHGKHIEVPQFTIVRKDGIHKAVQIPIAYWDESTNKYKVHDDEQL